MPGDEARRHGAERLASGTHDVALGAADIRQHGVAQVQRSQNPEQFFHRQNRHGQLNDIGTDTGSSKIVFTAVDHTQFNGHSARRRVEIDAHHFATQTAFFQTFGKRSSDQTEADHHQAADHRRAGLRRDDINHAPEPCSTPRENGCFQQAGQCSRAGDEACHTLRSDARSRLRAAGLRTLGRLRGRGRPR